MSRKKEGLGTWRSREEDFGTTTMTGWSFYDDECCDLSGMRDQLRCHGRPGWIDWNKTGPTGRTRDRKRINHEEAYTMDDACTNWAEEFFSRRRSAEIGIHHHIAGAYLLRYAQERSWRGDNRRLSNGEQVNRLAALSLKRGKSVDFGGYWQRHSKVVHA